MSPEEMSFRNLVEWHKEALLKIVNGALASDVFTEHHHGYLVKHGVLRRVPKILRSLPTPEAIRVLRGE